MNILILGDSWGVPNYSTDWDVSYEEHTEFLLKKLGYNVFNFSLNGGSMLDTMHFALASLQGNYHENFDPKVECKLRAYNKDGTFFSLPLPEYITGEKIDWILWFHTEALRDHIPTDNLQWLTLEETHVFYSHVVYRAFKNFLSIFNNPKTAIIGGQSPIDPILYQYHTPNFEIKDWRSEIVGKQLPRCVSYGKLQMIEQMYDDIDDKIRTLDIHKQIQDSMRDQDLFFDWCHPGPKPHKNLVERLDKIFKGK